MIKRECYEANDGTLHKNALTALEKDYDVAVANATLKAPWSKRRDAYQAVAAAAQSLVDYMGEAG